VRVITAKQMGQSVKVMAVEIDGDRLYQPILSPEQVALLEVAPEKPAFDGFTTVQKICTNKQ
jgi:hypothetical protein